MLAFIGFIIVIIIGATLRIKAFQPHNLNNAIFLFWHNSFLPLIYKYKFKNITVLVSSHRDGIILSKIIKLLGYKVIPVAESNNVKSSKLLILKSCNTQPIAIAADGPKGPPFEVKEGILKIAKFTKLHIVPVGIYISKKLVFNSWDKFKLPLPFSKCYIYFENPIPINEKTTTQVLKNELNNANYKAKHLEPYYKKLPQ